MVDIQSKARLIYETVVQIEVVQLNFAIQPPSVTYAQQCEDAELFKSESSNKHPQHQNFMSHISLGFKNSVEALPSPSPPSLDLPIRDTPLHHVVPLPELCLHSQDPQLRYALQCLEAESCRIFFGSSRTSVAKMDWQFGHLLYRPYLYDIHFSESSSGHG
jgi:hypothetical protein